MRESTTQPGISAWEHIHGRYDSNKSPLGPIGAKVIVHDAPEIRGTYANHGTKGYYVGPKLSHYRCYNVYIPQTRSFRTALTLRWLPHGIGCPDSNGNADSISADQHSVTYEHASAPQRVDTLWHLKGWIRYCHLLYKNLPVLVYRMSKNHTSQKS